MKTIWEKTCSKCGHEWIARLINPTTCPKCKTYKWDEKKEEVKA